MKVKVKVLASLESLIESVVAASKVDLNQDLAAVDPAGESIFKRPFGAQTVFRTRLRAEGRAEGAGARGEGAGAGAVTVKFFFDPMSRMTRVPSWRRSLPTMWPTCANT